MRSDLIAAAGEAFWGYVVQRELLGLIDPEYIGQEYGVPPEVWHAMGRAASLDNRCLFGKQV